MNLLSFFIDKTLKENKAFAHCDIPCGIYDPHQAQVAAHTVVRMNQLIQEVSVSGQEPPFEERKKIISEVSRLTHVKEEHGQLIEEELGTLQNDYFKPEHFKAHPNLEELLKKAVKLSIGVRQNIDMEAAKELLETVLQISEIFYKTKNVTPVRVKSVYPTEGEIVSYK